MSAVSIRLPDDISNRLHEIAKLTGRGKTFYTLQAIPEHIEDLEDFYLAEPDGLEIRAV